MPYTPHTGLTPAPATPAVTWPTCPMVARRQPAPTWTVAILISLDSTPPKRHGVWCRTASV